VDELDSPPILKKMHFDIIFLDIDERGGVYDVRWPYCFGKPANLVWAVQS